MAPQPTACISYARSTSASLLAVGGEHSHARNGRDRIRHLGNAARSGVALRIRRPRSPCRCLAPDLDRRRDRRDLRRGRAHFPGDRPREPSQAGRAPRSGRGWDEGGKAAAGEGASPGPLRRVDRDLTLQRELVTYRAESDGRGFVATVFSEMQDGVGGPLARPISATFSVIGLRAGCAVGGTWDGQRVEPHVTCGAETTAVVACLRGTPQN